MPRLSSTNVDKTTVSELEKCDLFTVNEFIEAEVDVLAGRCASLEPRTALKLKQKLISEYSGKVFENGEENTTGVYCTYVSTRIPLLDDLLGGGLKPKEILEICGLSGSGKTQVCLTISALIASNIKNRFVIYIDTKRDVSATRLKSILVGNGVAEEDINAALNNIKIIFVKDIFELCRALGSIERIFGRQLDNCDLLLIDSLSSVYFPFVGGERPDGISHLNTVTTMLRRFSSTHKIPVVITNLATFQFEDEESLSDPNKEPETDVLKPSMGKYWLHVPNTRLLIKPTDKTNSIPLVVLKSLFIPHGKSCQLQFTSSGIFQ